ncbi:hypothetical protein NW754_012025 [Fusarium falciforme]|nr:hypothetical protein NW754_012025 [Fusarium falciforme]
MSNLNTSDSVPPPPRPIRFVHNQGQPPSKRRRINAACLTCRKRKTRCAGERPFCSTCTKNHHRCLGYPEEIKKEDGEKQTPASKPDHERDNHGPHNHHEDEDEVEKPNLHVQRTPDAPAPQTIPQTTSEATLPPAKPIVETPHDDDVPSLRPHHGHPPLSLAADLPPSPTTVRRSESHRVPYFRYFGPTAIVPGFKQMVVSVRDRRRSTAGSMAGTSPVSTHSGALGSSSAADSEVIGDDLPTYDPNDPAPVHPLIINLVKTFFLQMGSSYPFLKQARFLRMVKEKRVEAILVDSICGLAARFSDAPALTNGNDKNAADGTWRGICAESQAGHC